MVSTTAMGYHPVGFSALPSISGDGRYVSLYSHSGNLVPADRTLGTWLYQHTDVFVRDCVEGTTSKVSADPLGRISNGSSYYSALSADGRFVAFDSSASDLVPADTNGKRDIFVRDTWSGTITRVNLASGEEANDHSYRTSISANGRFVAFASLASNLVLLDKNGLYDIFVHDRETGRTTRASVSTGGAEGNEPSDAPAISADGTRIAFHSEASSLVPGDTNGVQDVFLHDLGTGITTRVSVASDGSEADKESRLDTIGSLSWDGSTIVFQSDATNLVPGDTNNDYDVFVHELGP